MERKQPAPQGVFVVGAGRLGCGLAKALALAGLPIIGTWSPDSASASVARRITGVPASSGRYPDKISGADLIFLTVPDDAVASVCSTLVEEGLIGRGQHVVHCSGCLDLSVLDPAMSAGALTGSLHPLQSFADPRSAHHRFPGSTAMIDGPPAVARRLRLIAKTLGMKPAHLPMREDAASLRALYHAAAVMAAGGVVSVMDAAMEAALAAGLKKEEALVGLLALTRGALLNLEEKRSTDAALTGPAARGDERTVRLHMEVLAGLSPEAASLYSALSERARTIAARSSTRSGKKIGQR